MTLLEGDVNLRGKVSYVPQQAWMQNETLRENVLFGRKFRKELYEKVKSVARDESFASFRFIQNA